jgi:hypothetical protein
MRSGKSHKSARTGSIKRIRSSSLKSMGKIHKAKNMVLNPMTAMQQMQLLFQEKGFLNKQIVIFENKISEIHAKLAELDDKIAFNQQYSTQQPSEDNNVTASPKTIAKTLAKTPAKKTVRKKSVPPDDEGTMTLDY